MTARRLVVLVDGEHVLEWQRRALALLPESDELILLSCTNTRAKILATRHPFYYALNAVSVRNRLTRRVPLSGMRARIVERRQFASRYDGAWQRLPDDVVEWIVEQGAVAVVKLGMGLLRVPPGLAVPILSWHHGDPDRYRGRPAGFYEMRDGARCVGQIVQVISDRLDAGAVVAFAETRVIEHSWRATLIEAFRHSPLLLEPAIRNAVAGRYLDKASDGPNYRLPTNGQVVGAVWRMARAAVRRAAYGAFFEKRWMVATASVRGAADAVSLASGARDFPAFRTWTIPPVPRDYSFLADPFLLPDDRLVVEGYSKRAGEGRILVIDGDDVRELPAGPGHFSYPAMVDQDGETFVVPEVSHWSAPIAYRMEGDTFREVARLDIEGEPRLTDPTFLWRDGRLWLFANDAAIGSNALYLWSSDHLFGRFERHPAAPVRISPRGGRMAGGLIEDGDRLIRLGQSFEHGYGDGLFAFEIEQLTTTDYREREIGRLRFDAVHGPHSLNLSRRGDRIAFDWYRDRVSLLAGWRRLRERLG